MLMLMLAAMRTWTWGSARAERTLSPMHTLLHHFIDRQC